MNETDKVPSRSIHQLVTTLRELDVKFAIVGGVAVSLVATPRFTADIDAVILDADERLEWLVVEFEKAGYTPRASDQISMTRMTRVLTLRDSNGTGVDLMLGILPFDYDLVENAVIARLDDDATVPVASPKHLVVMKAIAWRDKDQLDIREIVAVNPELDKEYVLRIFSEFADLLEEPERIAEIRALLYGTPKA